MLFQMERIDWDKMLSHSHWVTFNLMGKSVRLCARCLGTVLGFSITFLTLTLIKIDDPLSVVSFCCLLCAPSIVDWITQSWGLRDSSNRLRLLGGFMQGSGITLFSTLSLPFSLKLKTVLYVIAYVFAVGSIGKWFKLTSRNGVESRL